MIKVLRCINKTKPDVIHAHLGGITFALPWAVIHKKPMIVTLHTTAEKAFSAKNEKIIRRYITKQNIKLVAVSEDNQKSIQKYFDIEQTKCLCVNNGIDIEHYYHNKTNYFTFLNVGRHDDNKNQKMIITCFAKLIKKKCNIRLILVGEGPNTELLKNQVREAGIENKVIFTGMIADPTYYYINSDCYIQSSHREAMPLSVLEAMASSLPIISTNVGGLKDVVDECNGFLIPDGDETALYIAMRSLYEMNSSIRDELGKSSRKRVVRYSSKKMAEEYENIYKKCV